MSIFNFMGGIEGPKRYHTDNILASGPAYHFVSGCLLGLSLLCIGVGGVLVYLHDDLESQCSIMNEEWLLKLGWAAIGLGIFFTAAVLVVWRMNWDFVTRFQQQQMHIVASSNLTDHQQT